MLSLSESLDLIDHKITSGYVYQWTSFGPDVFGLESNNAEFDTHDDDNDYHFDLIFDTKTQTVYSVAIHDYKNNRNYRRIHPDYIAAYNKEYQERMGDRVDIEYIDLEDDQDFVTKTRAIIKGEEYDTQVSIPLKLSDEELARIAVAAHEKNMTLNDYVIELLQQELSSQQRNDQ